MITGTMKRIALTAAAIAVAVSTLTPTSAFASGLRTGTTTFHYQFCDPSDYGGCAIGDDWYITLKWSGSYNNSNSIGTQGYPVVTSTAKYNGYGQYINWSPRIVLRQIHGVGNGTYFELYWNDPYFSPFPSFGPTQLPYLVSRVWLGPTGGTSCSDAMIGVPPFANRYWWSFWCWNN